jgi:hypothetical protein
MMSTIDFSEISSSSLCRRMSSYQESLLNQFKVLCFKKIAGALPFINVKRELQATKYNIQKSRHTSLTTPHKDTRQD